jgi:hypothetical protein
MGGNPGDKHRLDFVFAGAVDDFELTFDRFGVIVVWMIQTHRHDIGTDAGQFITQRLVEWIGNNCRIPLAEAKAGMPVPGYFHRVL